MKNVKKAGKMLSTFEREIQKPKFKKAFEKSYKEFLTSELLIPRKRKLGIWKGKVKIAKNFDELPEDILDLFEGKSE